ALARRVDDAAVPVGRGRQSADAATGAEARTRGGAARRRVLRPAVPVVGRAASRGLVRGAATRRARGVGGDFMSERSERSRSSVNGGPWGRLARERSS